MNALFVQVSGHAADPHRSGIKHSGFEKFFSLRLSVKLGTETYVYSQLYLYCGDNIPWYCDARYDSAFWGR